MRVKFDLMRLLMPLLLVLTAVGITATGIMLDQDPVRMAPLYISLFVMLLNSKANRLGLLLGSLNSILYGVVYFYYGLYGMMASAVLFSFPVQLASFMMWRRRSYKSSTTFRVLSVRWRIILSLVFVLLFAAFYGVLSIFSSSYRFLDTLNSLLSIAVLGLMLFSYAEYAPMNLLNQVLTVIMYIIIVIDQPEQLCYLVFQGYALICLVRTNVSVLRFYREQRSQTETNEMKFSSGAEHKSPHSDFKN